MTNTTTKDPEVDSPEYLIARSSGPDRATLARNLAECNFHGLRRLQAYTMAGLDKRRAFSSDLARGRLINSCPFPFEVAILRALHMGLARWNGEQESAAEAATVFMETVRFGVWAPHLPAVVEYPPEVFVRAFQGAEVHRDVPYLDDSSEDACSLDWMDFRTYHIPPLEKDLLWDLFLMGSSPWAKPSTAVSLGNALLPETREQRALPVMVARSRNRKEAEGRNIIGMVTPGASLHLALVSGSPEGIARMQPILIGTHPKQLPPPAMEVGELREDDHWLVATYNPPPAMAEARPQVVPWQLDVQDEP